jgi:hypothetical protein
MANVASFLILCVFLYGRSLARRNLKLHIQLMVMAFVADFILIGALVFGREALSKVELAMPLALKIHVPIAVFTVLFYFPTMWTGYRLKKGLPVRDQMRVYDKILTTLRILTLLTSLWVQFSTGE